MTDRLPPSEDTPRAAEARVSSTPSTRKAPAADAMPCDRCGTGMFRMHAVWRCPACGYKTDCCGW